MQENVIKAVSVNIPLKPADFEQKFNVIRQEIEKELNEQIDVLSQDSDELKEANARKEYVAKLSEMLEVAAGQLKTMPSVKVSYTELIEFFNTGELPPTIHSFIEQALDQVLKFAEKKSWWDWNAFAVAMLGVGQIIAGALLEICTFGIATHFATALISEGVGDIMFAIDAGINGTFSWYNYGTHKAISMAISLVTGGIGAWLSRGTQVVQKSLVLSQSVQKRVLYKCTEATALGVASMSVDAVLNKLMETIENSLVAYIENNMHTMEIEQENECKNHLQTLLEHYDQQKVLKMMDDIIKETLQNTDSQFANYTLQVTKSLLNHFNIALQGEQAGKFANNNIKICMGIIKFISSVANLKKYYDVYKLASSDPATF